MVIDLSRRSRPQQFTAVIESKKQLTKNIYLINFKLQNPRTISFLPGQTISLHIADGVNRSMSIASPPGDNTHVLMVHDISPMGPGSKWTLAHSVGDTATFMAPLGIFLLDNSPRKKVFVATGTGIAPFRSMLLDCLESSKALRSERNFLDPLLARQSEVSTMPQKSSSERVSTLELGKRSSKILHPPRAEHPNSDASFTLYWGLRHEGGVYWKEEFEELAKNYPNFTFKLTLSKPTEAWQGIRGRVTEHVVEEEQHLTESEFYLCGNREMAKEMEAQLLAAGVPKAQIYKEMYY